VFHDFREGKLALDCDAEWINDADGEGSLAMNKKKWLVTGAVVAFLVFTVAFNIFRRADAGRPAEQKMDALRDEAMHTSPFAGVRWRGSAPEVELNGKWYQLVSVNGVPADEIVTFLKQTYRKVWRKRFEEDLVMALTAMGKGAPFDKATLEVRQLESGKTVILKGVPWTKENRNQILQTAFNQKKANGGKDPRDDPSYP
jgi:hypothetical protein